MLTITGYYAAGEAGALYYFNEHHRYDPHANHTLLIGPYDDGVMQHGRAAALRATSVDPAALVDLRELRYQWFDHVLKGAAEAALLQDGSTTRSWERTSGGMRPRWRPWARVVEILPGSRGRGGEPSLLERSRAKAQAVKGKGGRGRVRRRRRSNWRIAMTPIPTGCRAGHR